MVKMNTQPTPGKASEEKFAGRPWHEWLFSIFIALSIASVGFVVWWIVDASGVDEGGRGLAAAASRSRTRTARGPGRVRQMLFGYGAGGGGSYRGSKKKENGHVEEFANAEDLELHQLLRKLRHTWQPRLKDLLVDEIRMRRSEYEVHLRRILGFPGHPYLKEAIYVAAALGMKEARQQVVDLMRAGQEIEKSMLAAEKIDPWSREDLRRFLETAEVPVRLTALKICAKRKDAPVASIVGLLSHERQAVREAALAALPKSVSKANASAIIDLLNDSRSEIIVMGARALAKVGWAADAETLLDALLANPREEIRLACLDALMTKWGKLGKTRSVVDLALRGDLGLEERGRAVLCLERTGSYRGLEPGQDLPTSHPYLKYFTARCLIQGGDVRGIDLLMEVVEANRIDFDGLEQDKIDDLVAASRKLLFQISGLRPSRDSQAWREWSCRLSSLPKRKLPAPRWKF